MKKLIPIFCLCTMTSAVFAQGLINFFNNASTLISVAPLGSPAVATSGPVGSYYFGLLTSPVNAGTFTFSGVYGTNQAGAGLFSGGANIPVAGWAAGTSRDFWVFGWDKSLGTKFNPAWLPFFPSNGFFGVTGSRTGMAGGFDGTETLPSLNIFGGATGFQSGFVLGGPIPEPSATRLGVAGVALLLIFHRKARCGGAQQG